MLNHCNELETGCKEMPLVEGDRHVSNIKSLRKELEITLNEYNYAVRLSL